MKSVPKIAYSVDNLLWTQNNTNNKNHNKNKQEKISRKDKSNLKRIACTSFDFEAKRLKSYHSENEDFFCNDKQCKINFWLI